MTLVTTQPAAPPAAPQSGNLSTPVNPNKALWEKGDFTRLAACMRESGDELIESLGMIVITVPLIFPVLPNYGIDPLLFGVILVLFVELGQISPPIGINLFVIQSIWDGKLSDVVTGTIPFHLIMFVVLALVILWPDLALWLPTHGQ